MKTITYDETKWKLMPVEPTDEMVDAAMNACYQKSGFIVTHKRLVAAIAAAPEAPQPSQQEPDWDHPDNRCGGKNCNGNCCKPSQQAEPVAWMRRWCFDKEQPTKEKVNGRWSWPSKFKLLPVSEHKLQKDDVPLYTAQTKCDR